MPRAARDGAGAHATLAGPWPCDWQRTFSLVRSEAGPALATQYSSCIFFMSASEGCRL